MNLTIWHLRFCLLSLLTICQLKITRVNESILIKLRSSAKRLCIFLSITNLKISQHLSTTTPKIRTHKSLNISTTTPKKLDSKCLHFFGEVGHFPGMWKSKKAPQSLPSHHIDTSRDQSSPANSTGWRKATWRKAASHWTEMLLQKLQQVFERGVEIVRKLL